MESAIVIIIIAAAACGLYRSVRRGQKPDDCGDCPLKDKCGNKNQKKSSNTCKNQK